MSYKSGSEWSTLIFLVGFNQFSSWVNEFRLDGDKLWVVLRISLVQYVEADR